MEDSLKSTPIFEGKINGKDIQNGVYFKYKCKVELMAILNSM